MGLDRMAWGRMGWGWCTPKNGVGKAEEARGHKRKSENGSALVAIK